MKVCRVFSGHSLNRQIDFSPWPRVKRFYLCGLTTHVFKVNNFSSKHNFPGRSTFLFDGFAVTAWKKALYVTVFSSPSSILQAIEFQGEDTTLYREACTALPGHTCHSLSQCQREMCRGHDLVIGEVLHSPVERQFVSALFQREVSFCPAWWRDPTTKARLEIYRYERRLYFIQVPLPSRKDSTRRSGGTSCSEMNCHSRFRESINGVYIANSISQGKCGPNKERYFFPTNN